MKCAETTTLEVRILDDGLLQARRKDRRRLTERDREEARELVKELDSRPGVTAADALRIWPGARIVTEKQAKS